MKARKQKKAQRKLAARIRDWEQTKEQKEYRKPGSLQGHN